MNILTVFAWPIRTGGHSKSALAHMKYLKGMGHDIYVMAPRGGAKETIQEFNNIGVEVYAFRKEPKRGSFPSARGAKEIKQLCKEKDIVLIHAQGIHGLGACFKAAIQSQAGFVFTKAGGPVSNTFPPRGVDTILYSQELLKGMMERYHLARSNISVIRARIDMSIYKPAEVSEGFIQKHHLPKTGRKVVMATRLEEPKRPWIHNLVKFAEQRSGEHTGVNIVIAGEGRLFEQLKEKALEISEKYGRQIIHPIGPIFKMRELNQLYNYADVVAGNGRGILEAMACGKAVVILGERGEGAVLSQDNVEDVAYYNFSGRHFRYQDGNRNDSKSSLRELLADDERLAEAGRFSLKYIEEHMNAEIGAKEVLAVYQKALSKKYSPADYIKWYLKVCKYKVTASIKRRLLCKLQTMNRGRS